MIPDHKPEIPEWFHQQFVRDNLLAETRARFDREKGEPLKRGVAGIAIIWLAVVSVLLVLTGSRSITQKEAPSASAQPRPFIETPSPVAALSAVHVDPQTLLPPLMIESFAMKELLDRLGAIEVQGPLYTAKGESYSGPLWVRKVARGEEVYLDDSSLYIIDGPFRLRLPANSTVYIYAPAAGLDWNGGWGVPIQIPQSVNCGLPGGCALRLEDLMFASARR